MNANTSPRRTIEKMSSSVLLANLTFPSASKVSEIIANLNARQDQYARNKYLSNGALYIILLLQ